MARMVKCIKLNSEAEGLPYPPLPGELGQRIFENVSKYAWADWVKLQTMMINEYGLNCADPNIRKHLREQCERYFFGEGIDPIPNATPVNPEEE
ncbi:MAG: oxidative damage protection protein [Duodenibacillus sp.]|nr:oxidative damage protection protein [Duodenibacillus sp.]